MVNENVAYLHNGLLFNCWKKENYEIIRQINGAGNNHLEWGVCWASKVPWLDTVEVFGQQTIDKLKDNQHNFTSELVQPG